MCAVVHVHYYFMPEVCFHWQYSCSPTIAINGSHACFTKYIIHNDPILKHAFCVHVPVILLYWSAMQHIQWIQIYPHCVGLFGNRGSLQYDGSAGWFEQGSFSSSKLPICALLPCHHLPSYGRSTAEYAANGNCTQQVSGCNQTISQICRWTNFICIGRPYSELSCT